MKKYLYSLILVLITAALSGYFTQLGIKSWYLEANKAYLTPESIVFQIVWPLLYATLVIGFGMVLNSPRANQATQIYFLLQLGLQIIWTYVFFAQGYLLGGLIVIIMLDYTSIRMVQSFAGINKTAAYILFPYLIWLLFASYLNLGFVWANPMLLK